MLLLLHFLAKNLDLSLPVVQAALVQRIQKTELQARYIGLGDHMRVKVEGESSDAITSGCQANFFRKGYFPLKERLVVQLLEKAKRKAEDSISQCPKLQRGQEE